MVGLGPILIAPWTSADQSVVSRAAIVDVEHEAEGTGRRIVIRLPVVVALDGLIDALPLGVDEPLEAPAIGTWQGMDRDRGVAEATRERELGGDGADSPLELHGLDPAEGADGRGDLLQFHRLLRP